MREFLSNAAALFAGIESLIVFVIIAIFAALSSLLQKRQRDKQQGMGRPGQDPSTNEWDWPGESSSSTPASNWEEELKRLLGQAPAEPPPPPPVIVVQRPAPPPSPPPLVVVKQSTFPPPGHSAETHEACPTLETAELVVTPPVLGRLEQSHAALAAVSHLDQLVAARLEQATHQPVAPTRTLRRRDASPDVAEVIAMFRKPRTARQAFIASQIFGQPRSLESARW